MIVLTAVVCMAAVASCSDTGSSPAGSLSATAGPHVAAENPAQARTALDLGFGGSEFDAPVQWTPTVVHWGRSTTNTGTALEDHTVGTSVIDVLVGLKLRLTEGFVLAGGVSVPVVSPVFQPDVLGTVAVEWGF